MNRINYILAFVIITLFSGCINNETISKKTDEFKFNIAGESSKVVTRAVGELDQVGIYGYYTATERWGWASDNIASQLQPNYYTNTKLDRAGTGPYVWSHQEPLRYWPPDTRNKVSFFAYAPYVQTIDSSGNEIDLTGQPLKPYPALPTYMGEPTLTYNVPTNVRQHIDLLYASTIDLTKNGLDGLEDTMDDGVVPFLMKHALTQITFKAGYIDAIEAAKGNDVKVVKIELAGIYNTGVLNYTKGWSYPSSLTTLTLSNEGGNTDLNPGVITAVYPAEGDNLLRDDIPCLMLIPQSLNEAMLVVHMEITNQYSQTDESVLAFRLADLSNGWRPGQSVEYYLRVMTEFITIQTTYIPWVDIVTDPVDIDI